MGKTNHIGLQLARGFKPRMPVEDAERLLETALRIQLNSNQYSALVTLAMHIGASEFIRSAPLRYVNKGELIKAALSFPRCMPFGATRKTKELRAKQKDLFLRPIIVSERR